MRTRDSARKMLKNWKTLLKASHLSLLVFVKTIEKEARNQAQKIRVIKHRKANAPAASDDSINKMPDEYHAIKVEQILQQCHEDCEHSIAQKILHFLDLYYHGTLLIFVLVLFFLNFFFFRASATFTTTLNAHALLFTFLPEVIFIGVVTTFVSAKAFGWEPSRVRFFAVLVKKMG